jgi:hypothetical protein
VEVTGCQIGTVGGVVRAHPNQKWQYG